LLYLLGCLTHYIFVFYCAGGVNFKTQAVVAALGEVCNGDVFPLFVTGKLLEEFGGTDIEGSDFVIIRLNIKNLKKELADRSLRGKKK